MCVCIFQLIYPLIYVLIYETFSSIIIIFNLWQNCLAHFSFVCLLCFFFSFCSTSLKHQLHPLLHWSIWLLFWSSATNFQHQIKFKSNSIHHKQTNKPTQKLIKNNQPNTRPNKKEFQELKNWFCLLPGQPGRPISFAYFK